MHWKICKHYNTAVTSKWYEHKPNTVVEGKDVVILWDMAIHTDKEITANRPDIVIRDKWKTNVSSLTSLYHLSARLDITKLKSYRNIKTLR